MRGRSRIRYPNGAFRGAVLACLLVSHDVLAAPPAEHLLPRPLSGSNTGELRTEDSNAPTSDDQRVLVEALTGLIVLDSVEELGAPSTLGVSVERLEFPQKAALAELLNGNLGQPISLSLLDEINQQIVDFARRHDRPVIDAFAPEGQDITDGCVRIIVVTARRGDLRVEGLRERAAQRVAGQNSIAAGEVITESALRADLRWLNRNPFRQVNAILERGSEFGHTDIIYDVSSRAPVRVYGGIEDSGSRLSGKERWLTGINWGNAFGFDHQLNYQFTSAFDIDAVKAHSFSYRAPFAWRHTLDVYGSHLQSAPDSAQTIPFTITGKTWQLGLRYSVPLPSNKINHEFSLGYDFKRADNDLEFGTQRVSNSVTVISQFQLGYLASMPDRWGESSLDMSFALSPGGMFSDNKDRNFARSRLGASADYWYTRIELNRINRLTAGFSLQTRLTFQHSNQNLIGSEQLGLGGYRSVRGYDDYELPSDRGLYLRNELRAPPMPVLSRFIARIPNDSATLLVFTDYGAGSDAEDGTGSDTRHLWSAGIGLRYVIAPYFSARLDYGWQLKQLPTSAAGSGRLHLGAMLSY